MFSDKFVERHFTNLRKAFLEQKLDNRDQT